MSEYKRLQELAGLINENEEKFILDSTDKIVIGVFDSIYNINQLKSFLLFIISSCLSHLLVSLSSCNSCEIYI